jgi:secondary thiamine-phosphate synthase enzyme
MEFQIKTKKREEIIDITELIKKEIKDAKDGIIHIFIPHTTAAITINEGIDSNVPQDILNYLNKIVPRDGWSHNRIDNNGDSHIKASLIGSSIYAPIKNQKLQLGQWQRILFCEFDGPRTRNVILKI